MIKNSSNSTFGKRIFIHVGLPKTGSSALQAFFSLNAAAMERRGVFYPFPEASVTVSSGTCTGNLLHVMQREATRVGTSTNLAMLTETYLESAIEEAIVQGEEGAILLSGEFITQYLSPAQIRYFQELSLRHRVTFISFVRDIHDLTVSGWKQHVKAEGESRDFPEYVEAVCANGFFSVKKLCALLNAGLDVRVRNYDRNRLDLLGALLQEIGLEDVAFKDRNAPQKNLSLSYWEAKATVLAQGITGSSRLSAMMLNRFRHQHNRLRDPYLPEEDSKLLRSLEHEIALLNKYLPQGETLRDTPHLNADTAAEAVPVDVVAQLLEAVRELLASDPARPTYKQAMPNLPEDFDPQEYLLRNPDVRAAEMDPVYHYLNHGRFEGRSYKATTVDLY